MKYQKTVMAMTLVCLLVACGRNKKSDGNDASAGYYSKFVTNSNGINSGKSLEGRVCDQYSIDNYGSEDIKLELDDNKTFFAYSKTINTTNRPQEFSQKLRGVHGTWRVENNKIILEGIGESPEANSTFNGGFNNDPRFMGFAQNTNVCEFNDSCFPVEFSEDVTFPSNEVNFTNNNGFNTGFNGFNTGFNGFNNNNYFNQNNQFVDGNITVNKGSRVQFCVR